MESLPRASVQHPNVDLLRPIVSTWLEGKSYARLSRQARYTEGRTTSGWPFTLATGIGRQPPAFPNRLCGCRAPNHSSAPEAGRGHAAWPGDHAAGERA